MSLESPNVEIYNLKKYPTMVGTGDDIFRERCFIVSLCEKGGPIFIARNHTMKEVQYRTTTTTVKPGCRACSGVPMSRISTPVSCSCSVRTSMVYGNG